MKTPVFVLASSVRSRSLLRAAASWYAFTTERWIREHTVPALREGRRRAGQSMDGFTVKAAVFLATGTDEEIHAAVAEIRSHLAFYASTPAYQPVLDRATGKVLFHTDNYVFRNEYELSSDIKTFFQESDPAFERMSQDFASRLVASVTENY